MTPDIRQLRIAEWPQLYMLCWNRDRDHATITGEEALRLYERHWRNVDQSALTEQEQVLIDRLVQHHGNGIFCPL